MPDAFDPYHKWLGISPKDQPPNHYRLLSLELFESDPEVIDSAANRQMAYLQQRATGQYAALSQKLLNELSAARIALLNTKTKSAYDSELKKTLSASQIEKPVTDLPVEPSVDSQIHEPSIPVAQPVFSDVNNIPSFAASRSRTKRERYNKPIHHLVRIGVFVFGFLGTIVVAKFYVLPWLLPEKLESKTVAISTSKTTVPTNKSVEKAVDAAKHATETARQATRTVPKPPEIKIGRSAQIIPPPITPPIASPPTPPMAEVTLKRQAVAEFAQADIEAIRSEVKGLSAEQIVENVRANQNSDARKFVCMDEARKTFASKGDFERAFQLMAEMEKGFEFDVFPTKIETLKELESKANTPTSFRAIAERSLAFSDEAAAKGNIPVAKSLIVIALSAARKSESPELVNKATKKLIDLERPHQLSTPPQSVRPEVPMGKSPLVGTWVQENGWRHEFLENGEARRIGPNGFVDAVGKWKDEGGGKFSAILGKTNEWGWKMTLQGNTLIKEAFHDGENKYTATLRKHNQTSEFTPMFAKESLDGWYFHARQNDNSQGRNWEIKNGIVINTAHGRQLVSDGKYRNFELEFDFQVPHNCNSGIYLRGRYELKLKDADPSQTEPTQRCGAIFKQIAPTEDAFLGPNKWNKVRVVLIENALTVVMNDKTIINNAGLNGPSHGGIDQNVNDPGPIMLHSHKPGVGIKFRNMQIKQL